jgi:anti-sigma factor RsiW
VNKHPEAQSRNAAHEEWELRLQDWLDGTASPTEAAVVEKHMASCADCTQLAQALRGMDEHLSNLLSTEAQLGSQFDAQLFSRIDGEEATRERARKTAQASVPEELLALRRAWHRSLLGIFGVAAVLTAVLVWALLSGALPFLSPATIAVAVASVTPLQWLAIGLAGGGLATVLTRWLQAS